MCLLGYPITGLIGLFIFLSVFSHFGKCEAPKKLLVVSFDGFRNDFFNRSLTPNFDKLMDSPHYKSRLLNVFPSLTFPNHFSIATGLNVEDHGVIASEVMDVENGVVITYGDKLFHYKELITPIWTLNEMAAESHHSGCVMWPGCDLKYRGINATYSVQFNATMPWDHRIDLAISYFIKTVKPANLVMLYFESPDQEEHIYGPNSPQTILQIKRSDDAVGKILKALSTNNLTDVNVIFLSDHGMEAVTLPRIIDLTGIIQGLGEVVGTSPVLQIYPKKGKLNELYSKLHRYSQENGNFEVYKKEDIPERYHYKNCKRAPPILAVAKLRYGFHDFYSMIDEIKVKYNLTVTNETEFGVHGYDPEFVSMQPFFIARGPKFDSKFQLPNRTIDLFGIFIDVLGLPVLNSIPKLPSSKGKLYIDDDESWLSVRLVFFSIASMIGLATLFFVFILFQRRQSARNMGYTLVDKDDSTI